MKYDLVVVGGGPSGLSAAKFAAERNLKVVLIETKKQAYEINRTCSQMLHLAPGLYLETVGFENGKITFPSNGFSINYSGAAYDLINKYTFSPAGFKIYMKKENPPAGVAIDKGALLKGLQDEGEKSGLEVLTNSTALEAENFDSGARVQIKSGGQKKWVEGRMLIAADGVNSRIVESLGLNEKRTLLGSGSMAGYTLENVENPYPNSIFKFIGSAYSPTRMLYLNSTPYGNETCYVLSSKEGVEYFINKGKVSSWFRKARIIEKRMAVITKRSAIAEPIVGNTIIVGDAAGTMEVLMQGGLLCGYKASQAVADALETEKKEDRDKKLWEYVDFWKTSIDYIRDPGIIPTVRKGVRLYPSLDDDELDYVFSLTDNDVFEAELNPFTLLAHDMKNIWKYKTRIQEERPALLRKLIEYIQNSRVTVQDLEE